jgi:hypothetical protein
MEIALEADAKKDGFFTLIALRKNQSGRRIGRLEVLNSPESKFNWSLSVNDTIRLKYLDSGDIIAIADESSETFLSSSRATYQQVFYKWYFDEKTGSPFNLSKIRLGFVLEIVRVLFNGEGQIREQGRGNKN